jgi:hypothetical protein
LKPGTDLQIASWTLSATGHAQRAAQSNNRRAKALDARLDVRIRSKQPSLKPMGKDEKRGPRSADRVISVPPYPSEVALKSAEEYCPER